PSLFGSYLLMDGATGRPLAVLDGARLTLWRTAAASALAARPRPAGRPPHGDGGRRRARAVPDPGASEPTPDRRSRAVEPRSGAGRGSSGYAAARGAARAGDGRPRSRGAR